jgi:hypothetical protein
MSSICVSVMLYCFVPLRIFVVLQAKHGAPLLQLSPAHLEPVRHIKQAIQAAAAAAPRNDNCEICKVGRSHHPVCCMPCLATWIKLQLVPAIVPLWVAVTMP